MFFLITFLDILFVFTSHSFTITCYGLISFLMIFFDIQFRLIIQSCLTLQPHGLQHTRPPCPSANSQSLLKLMSIEMVVPSNYLILCRPLLLLPSIFPSIRVFFPVNQFFTSSGQSIGASASASVLPMNIQD